MMTKDTLSQRILDAGADFYDASKPLEAAVLGLDRWWIGAYVQGPTVLELGCSDGICTGLLLEKVAGLDVVEGARRFCDIVREKFPPPRVRVFECLYENFQPTRCYDDVVCARSLEYLDDPVAQLARIREWLGPGGRLHVVVQNAASLHRRIGLALGQLPRLDYVTDGGRRMGLKRIYSRQVLLAHLASAGFNSVKMEGFFLKPMDYGTLSKVAVDVSGELIPALFEVGKTLPDELCQQFYALCRSDAT